MTPPCEWCGGPLPPPKPVGRRRRFCRPLCQNRANRYRLAEAGNRAELAALQAAADKEAHRGRPVPVYLSMLIRETEAKLRRPTDA